MVTELGFKVRKMDRRFGLGVESYVIPLEELCSHHTKSGHTRVMDRVDDCVS